MGEKYINVDLNDPRSERIGEAISNKNCKNILNLLAEREMSESDLGEKLKVSLNTIGYNVKKLEDAGLIEKVNKFFWSSRGKRINLYKVSNKKIVISPKFLTRGALPSLIISALIGFGIKVWSDMKAISVDFAQRGAELTSEVEEASKVAAPSVDNVVQVANGPEVWAWFLLGALIALLIVILWNWRKN